MESTAASAEMQIGEQSPYEGMDREQASIYKMYPDIQNWQWNQIKNQTIDGKICLLNSWFNKTHIEGPHCPSAWDEIMCWPSTPAGKTLHLPCPDLYGLDTKELLVYRECLANGTWYHGNWTNYTLCIDEYLKMYKDVYPPIEEHAVRSAQIMRDIYFFGSVTSLVFLTLTLFIFCFFKSLQCTRVSIHKNLVVSFILRFVVIIIMFEPFVTERSSLESYRNVDWLCKLLTTLQNYGQMSTYFWMFVEGLFLTTRIAMALNKEPHFAIFYLIGWVAPIPFMVTWALCMHFFHDTVQTSDFVADCWQDWSSSHYTWLVVAPIVITLVVNLCFLVVIISILVSKLTARHNVEAGQIGKAIKATVVLVPLLGLSSFLFFYKPVTEDPVSVSAYHITNSVVQSTQGIFVSIIYCFLNGEVQTACQKKWHRYKMQRLNEQQNYKRRTSHTSSFFLSQTENNSLRDKGSSKNPEEVPFDTKV